jgi:hypothetical protein
LAESDNDNQKDVDEVGLPENGEGCKHGSGQNFQEDDHA